MGKKTGLVNLSRREFLKWTAGTTLAATVVPAMPKLVSAQEAAKMKNVEWKSSVCSLCSGACGLKVAVAEGRIIGVYGDEKNPFNKGGICPKPIQMVQMVYSTNRVLSPMKKAPDGTFQKISWDEAIKIIAENHKRNQGKILCFNPKPGGHSSSDALEFFLSTNGIVAHGTEPICFVSEKVIRTAQLGHSDQTNPAADLAKAKLVLFVGANIAEIKAGQANWIAECRRNGGKVITIDTRLTKTAKVSDQFIMINPGTDAYLGYALLNYVIKNNLYDKEFVAHNTSGFDQLAEEAARYSIEEAEKITGIPKATIEQLAKDIATLTPGIFWSGRGIVMTTNSAAAVYSFESLFYIMGNIGKAGGGIVSHVQSYGKPSAYLPKELEIAPDKKWKHEEIITAIEKGEISMVYSLGNPAVTWPNSKKMRECLEKTFLVSYTLVMDDTAAQADIILPATHWYEEAGAQKGINRTIQWREQAVKPFGETKSGFQVWPMIAAALGQEEVLPYYPKNPEQCWEEIDRKYNAKNVGGISIERMKNTPGGVHWPCPDEKEPKPRKWSKLEFGTPDKKINFVLELKEPVPKYCAPEKAPGNSPEAAKEYPLYLNTSKVATQYHTQNAHFSWATEVETPYLEIHPKTAESIGIKDGDDVTVETKVGKITLKAKLSFGIHENVVNTQPYYGLNSRYKLEPANSLFPNVIDPVGKSFPQKNIQCKVSKA